MSTPNHNTIEEQLSAAWQQERRFVHVLLVNVLRQPARELKFTSGNRKVETLAILDRTEKIVIAQVLEDRVAFFDLAGTDEPQVERALIDALESTGIDFCL